MTTIAAVKLDRLAATTRASLAGALRSCRYELVPTASALSAAEDLPRANAVTITASPRRGIDVTIDLAVELRRAGLRVVPHIGARLVRDRGHLGAMLQRLADSEIDEIFVIGGDGEPQGDFTEALEVIRAIEPLGHRFTVGVAGYPEGHPLITDRELAAALAAKQEHASYVTTQMCFDARAISDWVEATRRGGLELPVLVGMPGVVALTSLMPVAARIGVGESIRFLTRHRGLWRKLFAPSYSPTDLLVELAPVFADPAAGVVGLHLYTFNQVAATEEWRSDLLEDLGS